MGETLFRGVCEVISGRDSLWISRLRKQGPYTPMWLDVIPFVVDPNRTKSGGRRGDSLSLLGLGHPISAILHWSSWLLGQPQFLISSEYGKFSFMFKPLSRLFRLPGMHAILLPGRLLYPSGLLWRVLDHSPYLRFYETPFVWPLLHGHRMPLLPRKHLPDDVVLPYLSPSPADKILESGVCMLEINSS